MAGACIGLGPGRCARRRQGSATTRSGQPACRTGPDLAGRHCLARQRGGWSRGRALLVGQLVPLLRPAVAAHGQALGRAPESGLAHAGPVDRPQGGRRQQLPGEEGLHLSCGPGHTRPWRASCPSPKGCRSPSCAVGMAVSSPQRPASCSLKTSSRSPGFSDRSLRRYGPRRPLICAEAHARRRGAGHQAQALRPPAGGVGERLQPTHGWNEDVPQLAKARNAGPVTGKRGFAVPAGALLGEQPRCVQMPTATKTLALTARA